METDVKTLVRGKIIEAAKIELAKRNFWQFCLYYDKEFFSKRPFLEEVAIGFQQIADGTIKKMAVSMPPRAGKSYITSLFCAWWLGRNPDKSVMRNTCTARLYNKFSYDVRAIIREKKFQDVFPSALLSPDKQNIEGWNLTTAKQVSYFGAGVGGTIIGFGANLAITDDLYKDMEDALSETVQESTSMWKQSAHNSRMEKGCPEIFIGTRWTKNDEIGKAIDSGDLEATIKIPALNEQGQSFCEDVKSTAEYLKIKADTEESIWDAEYMQEPAEKKGLLFPKSELKYFKPFTQKPDYRYCAVDPADAGNDDTSAPFCDLLGNGIYVTDVVYNNDGTDINIPTLVEKIIDKKVHFAEIEGVSAWILFAKDVRNKVQQRYEDCEIRVIKNTTNKQTRILAQSAFIKNHFYFLEEQYWTAEYRKFMKVLTSYMRTGSEKDDAPDSLAMASAHFMKTFAHLW